MGKEKILVTGANGQIGSVLTKALRKRFGENGVLATDLRASYPSEGPYEELNVLDKARLEDLVRHYRITQIYHLVAILSAKGEERPLSTWNINMTGLLNVLEVAREYSIDKVFFPSSIAAFGHKTPRVQTPQDTIMDPDTIYGISKLTGEHWCRYYYNRYGVDIRSVRYPGIIGYESMPGGGTTDYAVDIFHYAVQEKTYTCFLRPDTRLPMLYMPDAIRGTIDLMEAPKEQIQVRDSYNLSGMDFTPAELTAAIRAHYPNFKIKYRPDERQKIADSWSESINDEAAQKEWNWQPEYDLKRMTTDMIIHLRKQYQNSLID
ncbi:MAG: NAD-dependent epimerase/dehydratase family protein [Bacteroidota bacterium]